MQQKACKHPIAQYKILFKAKQLDFENQGSIRTDIGWTLLAISQI